MLSSSHESRSVALRAFWQLSERWDLTAEQSATLLATSTRSARRWKSDPAVADLNRDQLERISYLLGIFSGLRTVLGSTDFADAWVHQPNLDFGDRSPLHRMLAGNLGDLAFVRGYIDQWGCWSVA